MGCEYKRGVDEVQRREDETSEYLLVSLATFAGSPFSTCKKETSGVNRSNTYGYRDPITSHKSHMSPEPATTSRLSPTPTHCTHSRLAAFSSADSLCFLFFFSALSCWGCCESFSRPPCL